MTGNVQQFYDDLANSYHLIFEDWDRAIARQARTLHAILSAEEIPPPAALLDCACGIGTQALGLAALGYRVTASDLSRAAVHRAREEARKRGLEISCFLSDMASLAELGDATFDAVVCLDNALPHLSPAQLKSALDAIASRLKPNGLFVASMRDYDAAILDHPLMQPPVFFGDPVFFGNQERRIVHQVWDWIDNTRYTLHLFITARQQGKWETMHFVSEYRCLLRDELSDSLGLAGFHSLKWMMPEESGYYQPMLLARRR